VVDHGGEIPESRGIADPRTFQVYCKLDWDIVSFLLPEQLGAKMSSETGS